MKFLLFLSGVAAILGSVCAEELILFRAGTPETNWNSPVRPKDGKLDCSTSRWNRLMFVPPSGDLRNFDTLRVTFTPSRTGDSYRFTLTSNPAGATEWHYFYSDPDKITRPGKQTVSIDLRKLGRARTPVGMNDIQRIEWNFAGWEMKFQKGLVLNIEEIVLAADPDRLAAERKRKAELDAFRKQAELLPASPWIPVPPASDRAFWRRWEKTKFSKNLLKHAEKALNMKVELPSAEFYLDFSRNGNRTRYQERYNPLFAGFRNLTLALCLTGDTRKYLPKWIEIATTLCRMPTWVLPAHDRKLDNFEKRRVTIDLVSSDVAGVMATALRLLGDWVPPETAAAMKREIHRQVVDPFLLTAKGKRPPDWFLDARSNWNSVCLANCVRALLAAELDPADRGTAFAYALEKSHNYLKGFAPDGYCSEGISYWSYGFGHYLNMAALLFSASGGEINLLSNPAALEPALFPEKFNLSPQHFPSFSDSYFNAGIGDGCFFLRDYLLHRRGTMPSEIAADFNTQLAVMGMPEAKFQKKTEPAGRISEFNHSGVFVIRSDRPSGLSFAFKGGSNHEFHNHNDVGSYSVAFPGRVALLGDAGGTVYTRDSFNEKRYLNRVVNSYGHPVPVVDGVLQSAGDGTDAKVLSVERSPENYAVTLDLRPAYPEAKQLKKLERKFEYRLSDSGKIDVTDRAEFDRPATFEVPLISYGRVEKTLDGSLRCSYRNSEVKITVDTAGIPWSLSAEELGEEVNWPDKVRRYAIRPEGKHRSFLVKTTIVPVQK